jgi:hypothetical protein
MFDARPRPSRVGGVSSALQRGNHEADCWMVVVAATPRVPLLQLPAALTCAQRSCCRWGGAEVARGTSASPSSLLMSLPSSPCAAAGAAVAAIQAVGRRDGAGWAAYVNRGRTHPVW